MILNKAVFFYFPGGGIKKDCKKLREEEKPMNNKFIINANLLRKESEFKTQTCVVEKAVAISHAEFTVIIIACLFMTVRTAMVF